MLEKTCLHLAKVGVRNVIPKLCGQCIRSTGCLHFGPLPGCPVLSPSSLLRPDSLPIPDPLVSFGGSSYTLCVLNTWSSSLPRGTSILPGSLPGMIIPPELGLTSLSTYQNPEAGGRSGVQRAWLCVIQAPSTEEALQVPCLGSGTHPAYTVQPWGRFQVKRPC